MTGGRSSVAFGVLFSVTVVFSAACQRGGSVFLQTTERSPVRAEGRKVVEDLQPGTFHMTVVNRTDLDRVIHHDSDQQPNTKVAAGGQVLERDQAISRKKPVFCVIVGNGDAASNPGNGDVFRLVRTTAEKTQNFRAVSLYFTMESSTGTPKDLGISCVSRDFSRLTVSDLRAAFNGLLDFKI